MSHMQLSRSWNTLAETHAVAFVIFTAQLEAVSSLRHVQDGL
jgi:hypothetical protein